VLVLSLSWSFSSVAGLPGHLGLATVAVAAALMVAELLRWVARSALLRSQRAGQADGRSSERERTARLVHDTALQTLEAIALTASRNPHVDPTELLAKVGAMATTEAHTLRGALTSRTDPMLTQDLVIAIGHLFTKTESADFGVEFTAKG
jgi:signal transduction histidine kinase